MACLARYILPSCASPKCFSTVHFLTSPKNCIQSDISIFRQGNTLLFSQSVNGLQLVRRKSRAIEIAKSSLSSSSLSCKNFNVAHYSESIKGINAKLGILAYLERVKLQGMGHNSEHYISMVIPILIKFLSR